MNISVILPVHNLNEDNKPLFKTAVDSVLKQDKKPQELILVANSEEDNSILESFVLGNEIKYKVIYVDGPSIEKKINAGIKESSGEYISILEMDDEYSKIWFSSVEKYVQHFPLIDCFLPMVINFDTKTNSLAGLVNELPLAKDATDIRNLLDINVLLNYPNFLISGAVMAKSIFEDNGYFKENIKVTSFYEFLLRQIESDVKFMTIPRFGYKHSVNRDDSFTTITQNTLSKNELNFWHDIAKREYHHSEDRVIEYNNFE